MIEDLVLSDLDNFAMDVAGRIHCLRCRKHVQAQDSAVSRSIGDLTKACTQHECD